MNKDFLSRLISPVLIVLINQMATSHIFWKIIVDDMRGVVLVFCFCNVTMVSFLFCNHLAEEERADAFQELLAFV